MTTPSRMQDHAAGASMRPGLEYQASTSGPASTSVTFGCRLSHPSTAALCTSVTLPRPNAVMNPVHRCRPPAKSASSSGSITSARNSSMTSSASSEDGGGLSACPAQGPGQFPAWSIAVARSGDSRVRAAGAAASFSQMAEHALGGGAESMGRSRGRGLGGCDACQGSVLHFKVDTRLRDAP